MPCLLAKSIFYGDGVSLSIELPTLKNYCLADISYYTFISDLAFSSEIVSTVLAISMWWYMFRRKETTLSEHLGGDCHLFLRISRGCLGFHPYRTLNGE